MEVLILYALQCSLYIPFSFTNTSCTSIQSLLTIHSLELSADLCNAASLCLCNNNSYPPPPPPPSIPSTPPPPLRALTYTTERSKSMQLSLTRESG